MNKKRLLQTTAASVLLGTGIAGTAAAQQEPFRVITVPWVASRSDVPHEAVDQQWHYFQAVARGGNCANVEYRWDFDGNGSWDSNGGNFAAAQNRWNMGPAGGMKYAYPAQAADRLFVARVEGRCGAETDTAEFPIRVRVAPTRPQRLNRAVSNGLWYAHLQLNRDTASRLTWWTDTPDTSAAAQAFMNRGHRAGIDPESDPYVENSQWMVNFLLRRYSTINGPAGVGGVSPDVNGNGFVLKTDRGNGNYYGGAHLEAIASWGDMDYVAPVGSSANVAGRRLGDVVQDAAEYFMWAQSDIAFNGSYAGGWNYGDNDGSIDTSQVGWAAVALFAAEVNGGATVPDWVKTRTYNAVLYNDQSRCGRVRGGYGYQSSCDYQGTHPRSGAMLNALGFALNRNRDDAQVAATVAYIGNNFDNRIAGDAWQGRHLDPGEPASANYYGLYQITKGMRSFGEPIRLIGNANIDWYARYGDFLIRTQNGNGAWLNDDLWMGAVPLVHGLGLLIAIPTIFETPPVAVADATPILAGPGDEITFGHGHSYASDPSVPITVYRWNFQDYPTGLDLNDDGLFDGPGEHLPEDLNEDGQVTGDEIVWDFETADPDARPTFTYNPPGLDFGEEVVYRITLQVEDRLERTSIDDESVRIRVSIINHPPVALPHPSRDPDRAYDVVPGRTYTLDGSQSYDPDEDDLPQQGFAADRITSFAWDTDGDGTFETEGAEVQFEVPGNWVPEENRTIQFRVCDDGQWVGIPDAECAAGDCSLCSQRSVRFAVVPNEPPVALVEPDIREMSEGESIEVSPFGSSDPEGGALSFEWSCDEPLAWDVSDDGTLMVGAGAIDAPAEGNAYTCILTVIDDVGAAAQTEMTIRVNNAAPSFVVSDVPGTADEGTPAQLMLGGVDAALEDNEVLTYSVDCDGDGALDVIDSFDGMLECTWPDEGVFTVTVLVADDDGGITPAEFVVEVFNVAPTIDAIQCPAATEGTPVVINVRVRDPGPLDALGCALGQPAPAGSALNGCLLLWTPTYAQAVRGLVDFVVNATDGDGGEGTTRFQCRPRWLDEDGDGVPDTWEEQNGVQDPNGDPDGDGLTNQDEFDLNTDPHVFDGATPPVLIEPIEGESVATTTPGLVVRNARDNNPRGRGLRYEYQVYADSSLRQLVTVSELIVETPNTTSWPVPQGFLAENRTYWWTARANNGLAFGNAPSPESFVIDAENEAPSAPHILRPEDGDSVGSRRPTLVVDNATDRDPGDEQLVLECEISADGGFDVIVTRPGGPQSPDGSTALALDRDLDEHGDYFARCRAVDDQGLAGDWSETVSFTIDTGNNGPEPPTCLRPGLDEIVRQLDGIVLVAGNASDPEGDALTYRFEISNDPTFPADRTTVSDEIPEGGQGETAFSVPGALADNSIYFWRVRARDERAAGGSCTSRFRVDLVNEPPSVPTPINPWIDTVSEPQPRFVWAESVDPEGDLITYEVALYADADRQVEVWRGRTAALVIDYDGAALPGGDYWWQVRAEDEIEGHTSDWSALIHFIVPGSVVPEVDAGPTPEVDAALPTPDAAVPDAEVDAKVPYDASEADAAERDASIEPEPEIDAEVQPEPEKDAQAIAEPDFGEPDATTSNTKGQDSRSVSGAGCVVGAPAPRGVGGGLAAALGLLALALGRRRRR